MPTFSRVPEEEESKKVKSLRKEFSFEKANLFELL